MQEQVLGEEDDHKIVTEEQASAIKMWFNDNLVFIQLITASNATPIDETSTQKLLEAYALAYVTKLKVAGRLSTVL